MRDVRVRMAKGVEKDGIFTVGLSEGDEHTHPESYYVLLLGDWLGVVAAEEPAEGDDEIAERDAWGVTMAKMVGELDQLAPKHREMLLLFAHGHDIKAQAAQRDVDYSTLLDEFHRQCALVKARLKGKKIHAVPARPKDAPPALPYRAPPESDNGAPTPNEPDKGPPDER
jgi:hypothetical protein